MQKILQIVAKGLFAGQKWGFLSLRKASLPCRLAKIAAK
jgi:hypothetical protein